MAISYEKYSKAEWKQNPVLAQVKEMQREVEKLQKVLKTIEGKVPVVVEMRSTSMAAGKPNLGSLTIMYELALLKGWIDSLVESEIGLHVLTMPDMKWAGAFASHRKGFIEEQFMKWQTILLLQSPALGRLAMSLFGPKNPFNLSFLSSAAPALKKLLEGRT